MRGSCCCKAVTFELSEAPAMMATCHCTRCRKVGASIFVFAIRKAFTLTAGAEHIRSYAPEAGYSYTRNFCGRCGTALGEMTGESERFPVPANCFDDDPGVRNRFHEFVAEKPGWYGICDDAKQFDAHPLKD
ncbi:MAG: GFA family protein [Pacificimonas sp.]